MIRRGRLLLAMAPGWIARGYGGDGDCLKLRAATERKDETRGVKGRGRMGSDTPTDGRL
jgi:hypothetical protein